MNKLSRAGKAAEIQFSWLQYRLTEKDKGECYDIC